MVNTRGAHCVLLSREEVILLQGRLYDRALKQWFGVGHYACRPPGMVHGPYDADPEEGARQFVSIRYPAERVVSTVTVSGACTEERRHEGKAREVRTFVCLLAKSAAGVWCSVVSARRHVHTQVASLSG